MIKSVEFKNYRNLNGKYMFNNTLNIIFGKNNSGKTNLLDGIKLDKDSQDVQVDERDLSDEAKDILREKYEFNKLQLQEALLCIKQILNNQTYKTKYGRGNNSIFLVVNVSCVLNEYIIDQIKSSIDEEKYHLEIDLDEYNQTKIEVHLKSLF